MNRQNVMLRGSVRQQANPVTAGICTHDTLCVVEGLRVRLVEPEMTFGVDDCLTNKYGEPLVEFYAVTDGCGQPRGKFISRYLLSTLLDRRPERGLMLDVHDKQWTISPPGLEAVIALACKKTPMVKSYSGHWRMSYA